MQVGMGLIKAQKKGRDESTRRLSYWRKVVVKKDWRTTLLLLQKLSQTTEVEQSSSLSLPRLFSMNVVFLCFHPSLFPYFFQGHPYLHLIFTEKFLTLVIIVIMIKIIYDTSNEFHFVALCLILSAVIQFLENVQ